MKTTVIVYAPDGTRKGREIFILNLRAEPVDGKRTKYTCEKFVYVNGDKIEKSIPSLSGWAYEFSIDNVNRSDSLVLGISHEPFEKLKDSDGNLLPADKSYFIYNSFIDFHAICDVFARETNGGNGIGNLKKIGDKIIHAASNSKPAINLGSNVKEGSYFQNGEVTLTLKGVGVVDKKLCALVEYDSGESSFNMQMEPMPNFAIDTKGGSHYFGDIYVDLETNWVAKADLSEFVVSETQIHSMKTKISTSVERQLIIEMIE
ncbi:MAG: hypothetical protein HYS25_02605 [Ignavibacteriales bacterium]|nr:hypothetical protein [Ignavibacteriales bacterium]